MIDEVRHPWPLGHFYSPVPDTRELAREQTRSRIWPPTPREIPEIDWREHDQLTLLEELARQDPFELPTGPTGDAHDYHLDNPFFAGLDAWALQAMLRHLRPARLIEVGGGWSSLLSARVNRECLGRSMDFTCIEPHPAEFLEGGVDGMARLVEAPVQDVPVDQFLALGEGDVLFIDSSHVIKTGSDVQYLYHEVIPRLVPGVVVHVHDIFLPADYPQDWLMEGRGWNEQYLLRSFLAYNHSFEVLLGCAWLWYLHSDALAAAIPGFSRETMGGGSFWFRRTLGKP